MTTVISVRGRNRAELLADPSFVYVGRRCAGWPASIWGNPFKVASPVWGDPIRGDEVSDVQTAVERFEAYLRSNAELMARLPELRGKTLGCWCVNWNGRGEPKKSCHAVVLARMINPVERDLFGEEPNQ
jgi:hypothetical protein